MADTPISGLPELAEPPAATDLIEVVDVSDTTDAATGTNKKLTVDNLAQSTAISSRYAPKAKVDFITVTQAVDLDQIETDIAALANGMVYRGDWDASAGTFPSGANTGDFYYVTVAGTVDSISFAVGDNIVATTDAASTTVYAANWSKHDQTDAVQSVAGKTGSVTLVKADVIDFSEGDYATAVQGALADTAVQDTGDETIAGVKTFSSSPIVPAPTTDLQAATKKYVDDNAGGSTTTVGMPKRTIDSVYVGAPGVAFSAVGTRALVADGMYYLPILVQSAMTVNAMKCEVTSAGAGGTIIRMDASTTQTRRGSQRHSFKTRALWRPIPLV